MFRFPTRSALKSALDTTASLAFVALCGALIWALLSGRLAIPGAAGGAAAPAKSAALKTLPPLPAEPVSLDGAVLRGNPNAQVAVIEYSEFQCPFCGKFTKDTLPALTKSYVDSGKVLWAFRNFPLEKIHQHAFKAAVAAECAARQGKFWEMHDALFQDQKLLDETTLHAKAEALGLAEPAFTACLNGAADSDVRADMKTAQALGISGTPSFFIGRVEPNHTVRLVQRLSGAMPFEQFRIAIDAVLGTPVAQR